MKFIPEGPPRYAHQARALRKMIETRGVTALLYEPGTGKTAPTLDYSSLLALKAPEGEARVLVIAPLAALDTWVLQAETYVHHGVDVWAEVVGGKIKQRAEALAARGGAPFERGLPRHHGYRRSPALWTRHNGEQGKGPALPLLDGSRPVRPRLVLCALGLSSFSSRKAVGSKTMADVVIDAVKRYRPDLVVVDESHLIKGRSTNVSRAVARITPIAPRRIILTGTVMPHSPLDVFAQWRFLQPHAFGSSSKPATFGAFQHRYAVMGGFMGREAVSFHRLDEMQEIMAQNAVVATKADSLDLPPTTDTLVPVHLSRPEAAAYAEMKRELAAQLQSGELVAVPNRLAQMMRLRQITSGYLPSEGGEILQVGDSKAQTIKSIVNDTLAGEKRVVIFAHFRPEIAKLEEALSQRGTEVVTISGDTPTQQRQAIRKRFGSDDPARIILIAQTRTMSLAVNELVTASHAIFASLPLTRDDHEQARARLDRNGQTRPVTFWYAAAPGSVDEAIMKAHRERTSLERAVMAHIAGSEEILDQWQAQSASAQQEETQ